VLERAMTDIAYRCHHCGSVHEVEAIRENLFLNQRPIASFTHPQPGGRQYRHIVLRWRIAQDIARALWPRYRRVLERRAD
jgi:hypothetical protein